MQHQSVLRGRNSVTGTTRPAASPCALVDVSSLSLETAKPCAEISGNDGLKADVSALGAQAVTAVASQVEHTDVDPSGGPATRRLTSEKF
jgi:hypothetical protein